MAAKDPFAGIRLSEQTAPPKLDQRLFVAEQPNRPLVTKPAESHVAEAPVPPRPARSSPAVAQPTSPIPPPASLNRTFNINELPLYKASYLFTLDELEALEDLKLELRRVLDTKTTKNDLIRAALHMLVEDYRANRSQSYAVRKAKRR